MYPDFAISFYASGTTVTALNLTVQPSSACGIASEDDLDFRSRFSAAHGIDTGA
jgi:hypothetical protein